MPADIDVLPPFEAPPALAPPDQEASREAPATPAAPRAWRSTPPRVPHRRRRRLLQGSLLLALAAGAFLWLAALFAPPRGVEFLLIGAGYEQNLAVPHNVYGWNSLHDLAAAIDQGAHATHWARTFWHTKPQPQRLLASADLSTLAPRTTTRNWVLFVSAHAGVDRDGAYLIADDDTQAPSPAKRLRLSKLIEHLATLPREQHKVLVLDAAHFDGDATLGMLTNDFAVELAKCEQRIAEIPNLVVVCSAGQDEIAWQCPMWGRTTFAHFWIEGLRGAAADENANGRINLAELFDFTRTQTRHWVRQHYHTQQTPWLLPSGDEGLRRATRIDLAWKDGAYTPSTPSLTPPTSVPVELVSAWKTAAELAAQPTPPYVYQPQLWRKYLATLARYEQLALAGDPYTTQRLASEVQALALACRHDPTQQLSSLSGQRSSSAFAATIDPALRASAQDVLERLAQLPPEQWAAAWKTEEATAEHLAGPLRAEVLQLLIEQAISDPLARLSNVRKLAEIVREPSQPLCPTLHLALMMERDLPADARVAEDAPIIAQALRVRHKAEQATTGDLVGFTQASPRVRPWVAERLAAADVQRRLGEDLLFTDRSHYPAAAQNFTEAEALYAAALLDGQAVLAAYRARDRALALLPDVSLATINLSRACAARHAGLVELEAELQSAWDEVHQLTAALASPGKQPIRGTEGDSGSTTDLTTCAARVTRHLDAVEARLATIWNDLASDPTAGERLCLTHVPASAQLDPERRRAALEQSLVYIHRRKEDLTRLLAMSATGRAPEDAADQQANSVAGVQAQAQRRGELALAMLGSRQFEELATAESDTWPQAHHRLEVYRVDADWRGALVALGEELALRWRRMPERIDHLLDQTQASQPGAANPAPCIEADNLARNLPSSFFTKLDDHAGDDLRRRRLSAYLAWQAEIAWRDHWYAEQADETPYFAARARALLADAQRVAPLPTAFRDLTARFAASDDWDLSVPDRAAVTPEIPLTLTCRIVPGGSGVADGYVALRVVPPNFLTPAPAIDPAWRWPAENAPPDVTATLAIDPATPRFALAREKVAIAAYFRGRRIEKVVPVELHAAPQFAVVQPAPPATAEIAIEASPELLQRFAQGSGAVSIVLDCSGSMGAKQGAAFDDQARYAQATRAVADLLRGMPAGTQLSVWTFGQAMGPQKTVPEAEKTVRCVRPLTTWNGDQSACDALIQQLAYPQSEPWNESSVVRAMLAAKDELSKASGLKTMVVITDGIDNRFVSDAVANPSHTDVATGLTTAFRGSGISLNIVGFQIASHEEEAARTQFAVIESFDPPGKFFSVSDSAALAASLNAALDRKLRFWVEDYDRRTLPGESAAGWSPPLATAALPRERVSAPPGEYRLRALAGKPIERDAIVRGGDWLLAQLTADGDDVRLVRGDGLARLYPTARTTGVAGWKAALLGTDAAATGVSAHVALERAIDPREAQLALHPPRDIWWEASLPLDAQHAGTLSVTRDFDQGVVAWRLDYAPPAEVKVPAATTGALEAWWLEGNAVPQRTTLVAGRDFVALTELRDRAITADGLALVVREATWEAGRLILVVDGPAGDVIDIRVAGLNGRAAEQRHYQKLGRTVLLIKLPQEPAMSSWRIEFAALAAIKQRALEHGTHVRFENVLFSPSAAQP